MRELAGQGVPSDDVHFVLIGDPNNPAGGSEVVTSNLYPQYLQDYVATPNDLYPTDVYTAEYDGVADFPKYPINLLSDLNAALGFIYEHGTYLSLTSEQSATLSNYRRRWPTPWSITTSFRPTACRCWIHCG